MITTRLMVVSPHADDAELGCGGYMHRVVQEGGDVLNVVVAVGDVYFKHLGRTVRALERIQECKASMGALGVDRLEVLFPDDDGRLDARPLVDIVQSLDRLQEEFWPTQILIPLPSSHQDHEIVYRASLAATRPSAFNRSLELIAAYEYPATAWGAGSAADAGRGGMYVEIGEAGLAAKLEALRRHRSQIRENGHCWSLEAARAMAALRGLESDLDYAELFHVMREIRRCGTEAKGLALAPPT